MSESSDNKKTILDYVSEYHRVGWCVIPVPHCKKAARIRWGKYQESRPDEKQRRKWFGNGRTNMAVVLGSVSGDLVCRDFDTIEEYQSWAKVHPDLAAKLPTVRTANGYHVYFEACVDGIKYVSNGELRGTGGYCLLPPSVHPDAEVYEWVNPLTNGNLLTLDPVKAGFLPEKTHVTERAERTDENRRDNEEGVLVNGKIEQAISESLPTNFGTRHRRIFYFGRLLYSMPEYTDADPMQFNLVAREWHKRALPKIRTKEFEETWIDFLKGWKKIKHKIGEEPMAKIFETAIQLEPPEVAVEKYPDNSRLKILVSLMPRIAAGGGEQSVFLGHANSGKIAQR